MTQSLHLQNSKVRKGGGGRETTGNDDYSVKELENTIALLSSVGRNMSPSSGEVIIPVVYSVCVVLLSASSRHVLTGRKETLTFDL